MSQKLGEKKIKSHSSHHAKKKRRTVFSKKPPRLLLSRRFRRATATDDGADQRAPRERIHRIFGKKANSILRGFDSDVFGLGEERGVREEPGIHVRELLLRCDSFFWSSSSLFGSSVRFFIRLVRALGRVFFSLSLSVSVVITVDARARRLTDDDTVTIFKLSLAKQRATRSVPRRPTTRRRKK